MSKRLPRRRKLSGISLLSRPFRWNSFKRISFPNRARHESTEEDLRVQLAKLEGRLSATESTLLEKKIMVEDLEQRLSAATEESSTSISKYESQMVSLKAELESARNSLTIEHSTLADKDSLIAKLESEKKETLAKLERMSSLEKSVSTLQRALSEVQAEKDAQADELARIQQERKRDVESLDGSTRQLAVEKEEICQDTRAKGRRYQEANGKSRGCNCQARESFG